MLKKTVVILTSTATLAALGACARKRPVERIKDLDGNRYAKADFDDGREWLGKVTIVNNGSNAAFGFVGSESEIMIGSFRFTKDHLQYITTDVGTKEPRVLNEWSIEHSDYHQKVSGGRVSNSETENDQISYKDKRYFEVHWSSADISERASFPFEVDNDCWNKSAASLKDDSSEVDKDHISFTLAIQYQINPECLTDENYTRNRQTHTVEYKYSFMPDRKSDYKPYVYNGENDPLFRKYGYFTTTSAYVNEADGRVANTFLMNRWAPGKHTLYFAPGFPQKWKYIYADPSKGVIARTNQMFADAKIDLSFEIKDPTTEKFGDIRYSFINVIEDMDSEAPLGYGPATAHPRTGEILASNTTLWLSDLKYLLQRIDDQKKIEAERPSSTLLSKMSEYLGQEAKTFADSSSFVADDAQSSIYRFLLPDFTYANRGNGFASRQVDKGLLGADARIAKFRSGNAAPELTQLIADGAKQEERFLKEMSLDSRTLQRRSTVWTLNDSMFAGMGKKLADVTMDSAMDDIVYRVAIHEFGHNLNLRHNFYGSVDAGSRKDAGPTTSVMDYLDLKDEIGAKHDWEPYDRAALLYAYSNGAIDKIKESGDVLLYCTDEHLRSNPLCNQFDAGSTPTQVLMNMISQYDDNYSLRNFRNGRDFWNADSYGYRVFNTMYEVKKFFAFQDAAFQAGEISNFLLKRKNLDPKSVEAFKGSIQKDMDQSARLAMAFYAAIMKQGSGDRPFKDTFDKSSGALSRIGISEDKLFATRFLMGDDGFALDPNKGAYALSFASKMTEKGPLSDLIGKVMGDLFTDSGDMYAGFGDETRLYFLASAAFMPNRDSSPLELGRIRCYKSTSFVAAFGQPDGLESGTLAFTADRKSKDLYYKDEVGLSYILINGDFYVAGTKMNSLSAKLIEGKNKTDILNAFRTYSEVAEGKGAECR